MNTSKAFSTISFNTRPFLQGVLNDLIEEGVLTFWAFIPHKAEDDEGGKKDHFHVYMEPAKRLQTDYIIDRSKEIDPTNPKPKKFMPCNICNSFGHWFMYAMHDEQYLKNKGLEKKFHYKYEDFITSDEDYLYCKFKEIDVSILGGFGKMKEALQQGMTFNEFCDHGWVPVQQFVQYKKAWEFLSKTEADTEALAKFKETEKDLFSAAREEGFLEAEDRLLAFLDEDAKDAYFAWKRVQEEEVVKEIRLNKVKSEIE